MVKVYRIPAPREKKNPDTRMFQFTRTMNTGTKVRGGVTTSQMITLIATSTRNDRELDYEVAASSRGTGHYTTDRSNPAKKIARILRRRR